MRFYVEQRVVWPTCMLTCVKVHCMHACMTSLIPSDNAPFMSTTPCHCSDDPAHGLPTCSETHGHFRCACMPLAPGSLLQYSAGMHGSTWPWVQSKSNCTLGR